MSIQDYKIKYRIPKELLCSVFFKLDGFVSVKLNPLSTTFAVSVTYTMKPVKSCATHAPPEIHVINLET